MIHINLDHSLKKYMHPENPNLKKIRIPDPVDK